MNTSPQPDTIRPGAHFSVSANEPHLYENPYFPALGPDVALCGAKQAPDGVTKTYDAIDADNLRGERQTEYLENLVSCPACVSAYQRRFQA